MTLQTRFEQLKSSIGSSIKIHIVKDYSSSSFVYPLQSQETKVKSTLYLISTQRQNIQKEENLNSISNSIEFDISYALETKEYTKALSTLLHISKIDSLQTEKNILLNNTLISPLRFLIKCIIEELNQNKSKHSTEYDSKTRSNAFIVHVFARPAPYYLLPSTKKHLDAQALSKWWLKTLTIDGFDKLFLSNSEFKSIQIQRDGWKNGIVYKDLEECPILEDDALGRALKYSSLNQTYKVERINEKIEDLNTSSIDMIKELSERIKLSCDFKNGETLFTLSKSIELITIDDVVDNMTISNDIKKKSTVDETIAFLDSLNFDEMNRLESSEKVYDLLKGLNSESFIVELKKDVVIEKVVAKPKIMNVGSLVKRKAKVDASSNKR